MEELNLRDIGVNMVQDYVKAWLEDCAFSNKFGRQGNLPELSGSSEMGRHFGFTGSRRSLSVRRITKLIEVMKALRTFGYSTLHHGDCIGCDRTAHLVASARPLKIVIHPPKLGRFRAHCERIERHRVIEVKPPKDYLTRNKNIIAASELLVGMPTDPRPSAEIVRSGTWATIRYARKAKKPRILL